jgi:hypothetical protein
MYQDIVALGFYPEIARARLKSLQSPCALNVFIKTNTIIKHRSLEIIRKTFIDAIHPSMKETLYGKKSKARSQIQSSVDGQISQFMSYLKTLRAYMSHHVFVFLASILRYSNIKDCKKPEMLRKRVSILAILRIMLEQVLDLEDEKSQEFKTRMSGLGKVLLGYLQPPSILSFPAGSNLTSCFGKDEAAVAGVFLKDKFWFALYQGSTKTIPPHLLFTNESESTEPSQRKNQLYLDGQPKMHSGSRGKATPATIGWYQTHQEIARLRARVIEKFEQLSSSLFLMNLAPSRLRRSDVSSTDYMTASEVAYRQRQVPNMDGPGAQRRPGPDASRNTTPPHGEQQQLILHPPVPTSHVIPVPTTYLFSNNLSQTTIIEQES